jgi:hypothetical protein
MFRHLSYLYNMLDRNSILTQRTVSHLPYPVTPSPNGSHTHPVRTKHDLCIPTPSEFMKGDSTSDTSTNKLRMASEPPDNRSLVSIVGDKRIQRQLEQAYQYADISSVPPETDKLWLPVKYPGNREDPDEATQSLMRIIA